jgi:nucleoside-diphosphate-sugar epimerase
MKILVTGATGFIGQNLVTKLIENNHEVYALIRENGDTSCINKKVNIHTYSGNPTSLIDFFKEEKFDGVIHLASLFLASHNPNDISNLVTSNIQFGTELLEAAKSSNVTWFLNTGTFWQNYENERYNPVNLYAATKEAFETIAKFYTQTSNLVFTTIKLNDTFGTNDTRPKIFNLWRKIAASGERLEMSAGEQIIDISYIDDVVNAYVQSINLLEENPSVHKNKTYVITNEEKPMLKDLAKVFEKATDTKLNIGWGGREYRDREVMLPYSSGETVPGWKQQYTLEEAIRKTVKDLSND